MLAKAKTVALLVDRVTYEMMEAAWRPVAQTGVRPEWMLETGTSSWDILGSRAMGRRCSRGSRSMST